MSNIEKKKYKIENTTDILSAMAEIIDEIIISEDGIEIKTEKDIFINSGGNFVLKTKGHNVLLNGLLHLNPSINFDTIKDFPKLEDMIYQDMKEKMSARMGIDIEEVEELIEIGEIKLPQIGDKCK